MAFYAGWIVVTQSLAALVFLVVGILIFWRRPDERMALLASAALLTFGASANLAFTVLLPSAALQLLSELMSYVGGIAFVIFLLTFPDGRFALRWTRWLALAWVIDQLNSFNLPIFNGPLSSVVFVLLIALSLFAVVQRYRRVSNVAQRQQTKWVIFGVVSGFGGFATLILVFGVLIRGVAGPYAGSNPLLNMVIGPLPELFLALIPCAIAVAILRYHLWDIDIIIRRTLIYSVLTAILAAVYFGTVVSMQQLFRAVTGQSSDLAIVISTLAIAALFSPLRRRIQGAIDRRLYRRKYDIDQMLSRFSQTARNELDIDRLRASLIDVVQDAMQPAHVSLWLKEPGHAVVSEEAKP
jgi:hypothetical protein